MSEDASDDTTDLPEPEGIHPSGQLDARFPVTYRESVPNAMSVLTEYFAALARRDVDAMAETLQFPFGVYEGIEPVVVESAEELRTDPPPSMDVTGEGDGHVQPGSYDLLENLELLLFYPVGAVCELTYDRYDADGRRILRSEGIYAVTNNDGEWGIELLSTIVTPDRQIDTTFADAEEAARRCSRDWMLGYCRREQELLNGTRQLGRRIRIRLSNPRANARNAREGTPMEGYAIEGVESRLRVSEVTREDLAAADAGFDEFAGLAGGGVGQWDYSISHPDARVVHSAPDKAHMVGGYIRYTADSQPISETRSATITTYKNGRWGRAGGFGAMMYRDRTNDLSPGEGAAPD